MAWLQKLHTGLQTPWILCLSTLPPTDSWTLISKWNAKFPFLLDHLARVNCSLLLSPGKIFRHRLDIRTVVAPFLKTSQLGGSWWTNTSLSYLLMKLYQAHESTFLDNPLKATIIPHFLSTLTFNNDLLWLKLLVEGVDDNLLDNFEGSSLLHDCGCVYSTTPRDAEYLYCLNSKLLKLNMKYSNIFEMLDFHELYATVIQIKTKKAWNSLLCM